NQDSGEFKVPSLRNIALTAPYMHDGRYRKLREVVNHYADSIRSHPALSLPLTGPLRLSDSEKVELIAFLLTLNDTEFVFDPAHQYPRDLFK
ncbi:MAG: cytochrome-c peroxidase, partial [Bacteroidota bacterium]